MYRDVANSRLDEKLPLVVHAVVHASLLHKVYIASAVIFHFLSLAGDRNVSYVEARQKEVMLAHEKSC